MPVKVLSCLVVAFASTVAAQTPDTAGQSPPQRDLMDIARKVLGGDPDSATLVAPDSGEAGLTVALLPAFSVNPATGLLLGLSATAIGPSNLTA
ncbi:MAG: hypothetical protein ACAI18_16335, partial [Gemmatimonadales bacterium]